MIFPTRILALPLILLLAACANTPQKSPDQAPEADVTHHGRLEQIAPEPKLDLPDVALTDRMLYEFLLGDIAAQRGRPELAAQAYLDLAQTSRDPRVARRAAQLTFEAHQYDLSLEAFKLWQELEPSSPLAKQMLVSLLLSGGQLEEARPHVVEMLAAEPQKGRSFMSLYGLLARVPDKAAALDWLTEVAKPYPEVAEAHWALAQTAITAGKPELALDEANKSLELKPDWDLAVMLAAQQTKLDAPQRAVTMLSRFLKAHPERHEVRLFYARMLLEQKHYESAREQFAELLEQRPDSAELAFAIAMISLQMGELDRAEQELRQALSGKGGDNDTLRFYLGQLYEAKQEWTAALQHYRQIQGGDRLYISRLRIAYLQNKLGELAAARKTLAETTAKDDAQHVQLVMVDAQFLREAGQHAEGLKVLMAGLKRFPDQPELLYQAALQADRLSKHKDFEELIRKLIKIEPNNAHAYNALGYGWLVRNIRIPEAMELVEKAYRLAPDDAAIIDSMGWAYYRLGQLDKSLEFLRRSYAVNPDPEIAAHLGEVLWVKGEREAAQKVWRASEQEHPDNTMLRDVIHKFLP
ncbi:MAG: tetratricopeptide repeat protein [Gammaproteobacteria bacterium]|nr:tetratricopeptide repeat protein [Gammaproteobacteria bacterium]MBU1625559.1 tetratricopeptide repeat protein [Gammaproteobacteria bacterium]MBU1980819.1 tetratricopeptide repeat protein [Gammaproteobacteria bacterium]